MVNMKLDQQHFGMNRTDTELLLLIRQVRRNLAMAEWLSRNRMSLRDKVNLLDKSRLKLHFHQSLYSNSPLGTLRKLLYQRLLRRDQSNQQHTGIRLCHLIHNNHPRDKLHQW